MLQKLAKNIVIRLWHSTVSGIKTRDPYEYLGVWMMPEVPLRAAPAVPDW